jgi:hypothetical protein
MIKVIVLKSTPRYGLFRFAPETGHIAAPPRGRLGPHGDIRHH